MEIRGLCSMVFSMCLQSSQLTRLISLRHKPRAYNFCALEPNIPFWRVTYYPPIRKNLSFQILDSEAGCGSGHRELSGFLTLIFIGWSSNKCSSRVSRRSSDAKRAAKRSEPWGEGEKELSLSPFSSRLASLRRSFRVAGTPACRPADVWLVHVCVIQTQSSSFLVVTLFTHIIWSLIWSLSYA